MVIISFFHTLFVSIIILTCYICLRIGVKSLLAFTVLVFAFIDSLSLCLAPYVDIGKMLPFLDNSFFLINVIDIKVYCRQIFSHWLFLFIALIGVVIEIYYRKKNWRQYKYENKTLLRVFSILLTCIGLLCYFKYFIMGPGWSLFVNTNLIFSDTSSAIAHRSEVRDAVQLGQGSYIAYLSSIVIFPIAGLLLSKSGIKRGGVYIFLFMVLSMIYAIQTRQKYPILAVVLVYSVLALFHKINKKPIIINYSIKKLGLILIFVGFLGSTVLYMINFGLTFSESVVSILGRLLLVPGATETNYFFVFPDVYEFRGIDCIFKIPLRSLEFSEISIYDVAYAATGDRFSANASFLAVGWSGAGYLGVLFVSLLLVLCLLYIDLLIKRYDNYFFVTLSGLSIVSILGLFSGSLMDYIARGGVITPLLILILLYLSRVRVRF